jgi:hypothetical protein
MAETALAATSIASMAKHGATKAASSKVAKVAAASAAKMISRADSKVSEKHKDDKEKVEEGPDFEHGQSQRVFGVYIGFSTMHFVIREKRNGEGLLVTELWDEGKNSLIT